MPRQVGTVGGEVVVQVLRDIENAPAALQRVRRGELVAPREALVDSDQQTLVGGFRARPPEIDRTRRALGVRIVRQRRGRAAWNHRAVDRVEAVVIDAGAEEIGRSARRAVQHLPIDDVGLHRHLAVQIALEAQIEVVGAHRGKVVRIERAERVRLLRQQDLRLVAGPRILGILLCAQRRQLRQKRAVVVLQRVEIRRAERLSGERVRDRGIADKLPAGAADDGALAQAPPSELRVIEDPGAAADDGRPIRADGPRESHRRCEILVLLLRRTEIAAVQRREVLRLRQVVIEHVALVLPAEAVVEREGWRDLPRVLHVEVEPIVAACGVEVIRRLRAIADPEQERDDR